MLAVTLVEYLIHRCEFQKCNQFHILTIHYLYSVEKIVQIQPGKYRPQTNSAILVITIHFWSTKYKDISISDSRIIHYKNFILQSYHVPIMYEFMSCRSLIDSTVEIVSLYPICTLKNCPITHCFALRTENH